jgi:molybdopterin-guanine dinucleotide biosynthesis protein A
MNNSDTPFRILGIILAGGRGERLGGRNKALIELAGRPLIERVIERAAPQVDALAINANDDQETLGRYGLTVFADTIALQVSDASAREGPLAGIVAGLTFAKSSGEFEAIATFAVDTPTFPLDLVDRLRAARATTAADHAVAATSDGEHPVFGLWPVTLADEVERLFGRGVRAPRQLAHHLKQATALFADAAAFRNVNHPEDVQTFEAELRRS